tara:strand:- start:1106 stop:1354 length:249 start_codon:yes stop_codon:yes gene_type:complete
MNIERLTVILLLLFSGCSDLSEVFEAQQKFVCSERGGVYKDSFGMESTVVGSVKCNDGTWQEFADIELPRELWLNNGDGNNG